MLPPFPTDTSFAAYLDGIVRCKPVHTRSSTAAVALDLVTIAGSVRSRSSLAEEVSRLYDGKCAQTLADGLREALNLWGLYDTWIKADVVDIEPALPTGVSRLDLSARSTATGHAAKLKCA